MSKINLVLLTLSLLLVLSCSKNPVTGRRQVKFFPESQMIALSATQYGQFITENKEKVLPLTDKRSQMVTRVGEKLSKAVDDYLREIGHPELTQGFQWEYNTVEDATVNAWCMPGGRIVFYTGILELCENDDDVAVVMGHEIAHAIAGHGTERMSQGLLAQGISTAAQIAVLAKEQQSSMDNLLLQSIGIGSQLGMLAFSRNQELESDDMGLKFMNYAGYNVNRAVLFWQKMSKMGANKPPEILSTHPSDEKRIKQIQDLIQQMNDAGILNNNSK